MKTAFLAAFLGLAIAAPIATTAPALADASVTLRFGDDDNRYDARHDRGLHRGWHKDRRWKKERRVVRRECEIRTERYWRNGLMIVERTRVCD